MKNRNIRLAFNYEGDIVPNEYGKMGKSKDSSGLDSFSSPLSVGDMLDVQIFIKTGSLLTLSLNPPVSLSSEFRDKRRERQKLVFSRLRHEPALQELRGRANSGELNPWTIGDDLKSLRLNPDSPEDLLMLLKLLEVSDSTEFDGLESPIQVIILPDEGMLLVEVEPNIKVEELRRIGQRLGEWCSTNFPEQSSDPKFSPDIKRRSEWVPEYGLKPAYDVVYDQWLGIGLNYWWLKLPMDVSYNWLKDRSKDITRLLGKVEKTPSPRKSEQKTKFVVDPFGRGIESIGKEGDRKKLQGYNTMLGQDRKTIVKQKMRGAVEQFLSSFSERWVESEKYGLLLRDTIGQFDSFEDFVRAVKETEISSEKLEALKSARIDWNMVRECFESSKSRLDDVVVLIHVGIMDKTEILHLESVFQVDEDEAKVKGYLEGVTKAKDKAETQTEILFGLGEIENPGTKDHLVTLKQGAKDLSKEVDVLTQYVESLNFDPDTRKKAMVRYDREARMQIIVDEALYSICKIYHYSEISPSNAAKGLRAELISATDQLLSMKRRSVADLVIGIESLEMGMELDSRIPEIQLELTKNMLTFTKELRKFWSELKSKADNGPALLPPGIEDALKNANFRYRGFDEDAAWEAYWEQNPRAVEVGIYDGEPDYTIEGFKFSWLRMMYQDLDEFRK